MSLLISLQSVKGSLIHKGESLASSLCSILRHILLLFWCNFQDCLLDYEVCSWVDLRSTYLVGIYWVLLCVDYDHQARCYLSVHVTERETELVEQVEEVFTMHLTIRPDQNPPCWRMQIRNFTALVLLFTWVSWKNQWSFLYHENGLPHLESLLWDCISKQNDSKQSYPCCPVWWLQHLTSHLRLSSSPAFFFVVTFATCMFVA